MRDPYTILGVHSNASQGVIKKEYRRLARENHPDTKPGDVRAENHFKEISNAYAILSSPAKRKKFDAGQLDANGNETNTGFGFGSGFSKTKRTNSGGKSRFDHFFRDRAKKSSIKAKGANVTYTLAVPFIEAALGVNKTVRMANNKTLKISLPAGTIEGQVLRLKSQGMKGIGGGVDGDALVEIQITPHGLFERTGLDIFSEIPVAINEAMFGGPVETQTIHGTVSLKVPENSNSGTRLRLKGRGIKTTDGKIGDQYVTLKVMLPEKRDKTFSDFIRTWVRANPYNPRYIKSSENAVAPEKSKKRSAAAE